MTFRGIKKGLGDRLREAREQLGLKQRDFAEAAEIPLPTLKDYEGGKSIPGGEALAKFHFIGINAAWLFGAEGEPLDHRTEAVRRKAAPHASEPHAGYVYLPLHEVRAGAGRSKIAASERVVDALAFKEDWIRQELHASPGDLRLIYVAGDSMEPDLRAGDIILIDHTDTRASREGIYVIRMDDALLVKQLQRLPGGVVKIISRNPAYEPFSVPLASLGEPDGLAIIGRVVWTCRRL